MGRLTFDEAAWWGDCGNTFHEEEKQLVYTRYMGLLPIIAGPWQGGQPGHPPSFDLDRRSVIDVGGGPVSLLLKCVNRSPACRVIDPALYPPWVAMRYAACGIRYDYLRGEDMDEPEWVSYPYDEAWCYNVLQHVDDPERVAANMRRAAAGVRVFEWIDLPAYPGHPQALTEADLNRWFGVTGGVADVDESGATGRAWFVAA